MAKDYLRDDNGDLAIDNGGLVTGFSDEKHVKDLLLARKGHYTEVPKIGVGVGDFLQSPGTKLTQDKLQKEIQLMLEADGASNINVEVSNSLEIIIKSAEYEA